MPIKTKKFNHNLFQNTSQFPELIILILHHKKIQFFIV